MSIHVTVWNEFLHEKENEDVRKLYPEGMHQAIASGIASPELEVKTATLDEPDHGITDELLEWTDVMIWWGHKGHGKVNDAIAAKVQTAVLNGMGLIVLHSGHFSKPFKMLMGTSCALKWREVAEKERLWTVEPSHPIAEGIGEYIELPNTEMYGERFDIPTPDKIIFMSWFEGGEVFRSGCTFQRGHGRIFYFRPGHETYPIFHNQAILKVIGNAVRWAARRVTIDSSLCKRSEPLEEIPEKDVDFGSVSSPKR